jgi:dTDP-4-dehydrorhamnose reductase
MKVLVTGVKGQLGYDVVEQLTVRGIECKGVDIDDFDLTDKSAVESYISNYAPDVIVHCAAFTAVDKAEEARDVCYKVNVEGTKNIRAAAEKLNAKLMYFSTDYIFDGTGERAWEPDDKADPCNYYGLTKYQGEQVLEGYEKLFILRISWVFGLNGNNFIKSMLRLAQTRNELSVVSDQIGSPTYTADLAILVCDMIETEKYGIYHATNEGYCSWAEFAEFIFENTGKDVTVHHITTEQFGAPANRPKNSRMSKQKLIDNGFALLPTWQDATMRYLALIEK